MKIIKDWNRGEINENEIFHFKNSLRPFISVQDAYGEYLFLDFDKKIVYSLEDLVYESLSFYKKEDDKEFMGVEIDGKLDWVEVK